MVFRLPDDLEILSRCLAGDWQGKAAETLLPRDQDSEIFGTLAQLCALGSKIYPQGFNRSVGANQNTSAEAFSFIGMTAEHLV
jgi:hypothetical protein